MAIKKELIKKIAQMYAEDTCSQRDIASQLKLSQSTVSRYIRQGMKTGIISRNLSFKRPGELMGRRELIREKYNLKEVIIAHYPNLASSTGISSFEILGEAAAQYVEKALKSGMRVLVSHGRSVYHTITPLIQKRMELDIHPLTLVRGLGIDSGKIPAWVNAAGLGTKFWMDQKWDQVIPQYLKEEEGSSLIRNIEKMLDTPVVQEVLSKMRTADVILQGVGILHKEATFVRVARKIGIAYEEFERKGVVGSVCHTPIDAEGRPITLLGLDKLAITINLDRLRELSLDKNRHIILIAAGTEKLDIIETCLKSEYCNVLVTDEFVADGLASK